MPQFDAQKYSHWEPSHPGAILREDVLPALRMKPAEAARRIGVSRQALHNVLTEKSAVTPDMALRLGKLCGNGPALWLRLQMRAIFGRRNGSWRLSSPELSQAKGKRFF